MYRDISPKIDESKKLRGYNTVQDIEAIRNSLRNLFAIRIGTVPGKPWLGNPVWNVLFENINEFTVLFVEEAMRNILEKYEPRVTLRKIKVLPIEEHNRIDLKIEYSIILKGQNLLDSITIRDYNSVTSIDNRNLSDLSI